MVSWSGIPRKIKRARVLTEKMIEVPMDKLKKDMVGHVTRIN